MIKLLIAIAVMFAALFALGYNILDPDGYVNTLTQPLGVTPTFQGGNPISQISDPLISWVNSSLQTRWGFIIVLLGLGLLFAYIRTPAIAAFFSSYAVYVVGVKEGWPSLSFLCLGTLIGVGIISLILTHRKDKQRGDRFKGIILTGFILLLAGTIALYVATQFFHILIPGWNY